MKDERFSLRCISEKKQIQIQADRKSQSVFGIRRVWFLGLGRVFPGTAALDENQEGKKQAHAEADTDRGISQFWGLKGILDHAGYCTAVIRCWNSVLFKRLHQLFESFPERIIDGEIMSVFVVNALSPGVKLKDVVVEAIRIGNPDLIS